jgi:hypothetical protein
MEKIDRTAATKARPAFDKYELKKSRAFSWRFPLGRGKRAVVTD